MEIVGGTGTGLITSVGTYVGTYGLGTITASLCPGMNSIELIGTFGGKYVLGTTTGDGPGNEVTGGMTLVISVNGGTIVGTVTIYHVGTSDGTWVLGTIICPVVYLKTQADFGAKCDGMITAFVEIISYGGKCEL